MLELEVMEGAFFSSVEDMTSAGMEEEGERPVKRPASFKGGDIRGFDVWACLSRPIYV